MNAMKRMISTILCAILIVTAIPFTSEAAAVKLNKTSATVLVSKTVQLKVMNTKKSVKWSTSNKKVATVSQKGLVKGKKIGKATVTAKIGKKKYTCKITVKAGLNTTKKTLTTGDTFQLKLYGASKGRWTTSSSSVATVSSKGIVTAKKAGTTTITAKDGATKYTCKITVKAEDWSKLVDFIVDVPEGREMRVLQLTDTQIIDAAQAHEGRGGVDYVNWATDKMGARCFDYVNKTVQNTKPDLILMTGDLVYGEFDDNGTSLLALIDCMESLGVPWAPVFGNHDNESKKGVDWQCRQLEAAENCLFKQRELTGNGNYTVGIRQGGRLKRVFFMLDSNGCSEASEESMANGHTVKKVGFGEDQIEWYTEIGEALRKAAPDLGLSFAFHIQLMKFKTAYKKYGFTNSGTKDNPINIDKLVNKEDTDFGYLGRDLKAPWDSSNMVWNGLKALGVDSIFVGHEHCNSASVVYDGMRFQYGQKSSTYDRANYVTTNGTIVGSYDCNTGIPLVGGTVIPLAGDGSIKTPYIYYCEDMDMGLNLD